MFASNEDLDLVGPVPQSASLHKPVSYQEIRQMQMDRLEKAGVLQPTAGKGGKKHGAEGHKYVYFVLSEVFNVYTLTDLFFASTGSL